MTPRRASLLPALALGAVTAVACHRPAAPSTPAASARGAAPASASRAASTASRTAAQPAQPARPADPRLAEIDARIAGFERAAAARNDDWLDLEFVAQGYIARARASTDYDDYARAEEALERAFRRAPQGSGPLMTRANLHYTLHRLARADADLTALERSAYLTPDQRDAIATLRADVAFHSGRYREAREGYARALERSRSPANLVALAQYEWKTGGFDAAGRLLDEATRAVAGHTPAARAWIFLVRGLMELDRGRWDDALAYYQRGLALNPHDHVLREHAAEIQTLQGRTDESLPTYLELIEQTNEPEFMDAAAEIYLSRGDRARAAPLIARASAVYERRLARFPEASGAHALEHYLRFEPARAVRVAEINRDARPGGEAQVLLARAYLRAGRAADARAVIDVALASPWNTAELHAAAAAVYGALHDAPTAARERERALALNPHAMDDAEEWAPSASANANAVAVR